MLLSIDVRIGNSSHQFTGGLSLEVPMALPKLFEQAPASKSEILQLILSTFSLISTFGTIFPLKDYFVVQP